MNSKRRNKLISTVICRKKKIVFNSKIVFEINNFKKKSKW